MRTAKAVSAHGAQGKPHTGTRAAARPADCTHLSNLETKEKQKRSGYSDYSMQHEKTAALKATHSLTLKGRTVTAAGTWHVAECSAPAGTFLSDGAEGRQEGSLV